MTQVDLFTAAASTTSSGRRSAGVTLVGWLPVVAALALTAQIGLTGLRPALREAKRLDAEEARLVAEQARLEEESQGLRATLRAQEDPVYLERERRMLLDPEPAR